MTIILRVKDKFLKAIDYVEDTAVQEPTREPDLEKKKKRGTQARICCLVYHQVRKTT